MTGNLGDGEKYSLFAPHIGILGRTYDIFAEHYSSYARKYVIRRTSCHAAYFTDKSSGILATIFSAFRLSDFVLLAFALLLLFPIMGKVGESTSLSINNRSLLYKFIPIKNSGLVNLLSEPSVFWSSFLFVITLIRIFFRYVSVAEEEVLVISGLGIQMIKRNFMGSVIKCEFINAFLIRDIIIHEAFFRHRVIFFIALIVENENNLKVLFTESLPRLGALIPIFRGLRRLLLKEPEFGPSLAEKAWYDNKTLPT